MVGLDILGACNSAPYGTEQNCFQSATELKVCRTPVALHSGGGKVLEEGLGWPCPTKDDNRNKNSQI